MEEAPRYERVLREEGVQSGLGERSAGGERGRHSSNWVASIAFLEATLPTCCRTDPRGIDVAAIDGLNEELHAYLLRWGIREHDELRAIRDETAGMPGSHIMLAPEEAQLMMMLARLSDARRYLEIGTFTGYSTLAMALALPSDGSVVACELERRYIEIARRHWERAGVADLIDVRIGPAIETLASLHADPFDIAFIDADKENLLAYYERVLSLIRPGGLVLIDNTLWDGAVADQGNDTAATRALRELNRRVHDDIRVEAVLVPVGDGLTIARKAA